LKRRLKQNHLQMGQLVNHSKATSDSAIKEVNSRRYTVKYMSVIIYFSGKTMEKTFHSSLTEICTMILYIWASRRTIIKNAIVLLLHETPTDSKKQIKLSGCVRRVILLQDRTYIEPVIHWTCGIESLHSHSWASTRMSKEPCREWITDMMVHLLGMLAYTS
jgi:hypothetical protein